MIILCKELDAELARIWSRMQTIITERHIGINQIDCDRLCVEEIERLTYRMELDQATVRPTKK